MAKKAFEKFVQYQTDIIAVTLTKRTIDFNNNGLHLYNTLYLGGKRQNFHFFGTNVNSFLMCQNLRILMELVRFSCWGWTSDGKAI